MQTELIIISKMKNYTLEFLDKDAEEEFQIKEHNERIGLLRYFLILKWCLSVLQIIFYISEVDTLGGFK